MSEAADATPYLPDRLSMRALREAAEDCRGCALHENATQTVFGAGPVRSARMMLVGEQPGDREDREGSRSSARPAACSTAPWTTRGSSVATPT